MEYVLASFLLLYFRNSFIKRLDDRKLVRFELLVFRGVGIIMSPLSERNVFTEQEDEAAVHLIKVIDNFDKIKYNGHEQCLLCLRFS